MLENKYLESNISRIKEVDSICDTGEAHFFDVEADFVEQYKDSEGIIHLKTFFEHDKLPESELWEVYGTADGSSPLEMLLDI